jgi:hypothetical protein
VVADGDEPAGPGRAEEEANLVKSRENAVVFREKSLFLFGCDRWHRRTAPWGLAGRWAARAAQRVGSPVGSRAPAKDGLDFFRPLTPGVFLSMMRGHEFPALDPAN